MINNVVRFLLNSMICNGIITDHYDVYQYGIELVVSSTICVIISCLAGWLLGYPLETLIYILCFIILRLYSGGFHATTHFGCWATMLCLVLGLIMVISQVFISFYHISIISLISIAIIAFFSPVENKKKPILHSQRKKLKIQSILFSSLLNAIALLCINLPNLSITLHYVNITIALLILCEEVKQ